MLALLYLAIAICLGDRICRRFYPFVSVPHRLAAAFLIGVLISSWFTYLTARAFANTPQPLFWGNLLFFATATGVIILTWRRKAPSNSVALPNSEDCSSSVRPGAFVPRPAGSSAVDWLFIGAYVALACWLMFATLNSTGDNLQISGLVGSDFGPHTAVVQSFAVGKNFPTQYPHFAGEKIRYHFLFWFQAGNLEFLGLDPAWSINLLSIFSMVALLISAMVLGEVLFNSRAVGRVGSALFFFFGSVAYIPFLAKQESAEAAVEAIRRLNYYLPSIWPAYRGEGWGLFSQNVLVNQRHLAGSIAILLLVLIFLVLCYRSLPAKPARVRARKLPVAPPPLPPEPTPENLPPANSVPTDAPMPATPDEPAVILEPANRGEPGESSITADTDVQTTSMVSPESAQKALPPASPVETGPAFSRVPEAAMTAIPEGPAVVLEPTTATEPVSASSAATDADVQAKTMVCKEAESESASEAPTLTGKETDPASGEVGAQTVAAEVTPPQIDEQPEKISGTEVGVAQEPAPAEKEPALPDSPPVFRKPAWAGFLFSGALLGLLPMWNSAVFIGAAVFLAGLFLFLPLRGRMLALAVVAGIFALPQIVYLSAGSPPLPQTYWGYALTVPILKDLLAHIKSPSWLHWGYVMSPPNCSLCLNNPTIGLALKYLGFLAGFKLLPAAIALILSNRLQRRFFLAALGLVALTFFFQLSVEVVANHKFLHVWIIVLNLFAAYGLYRLWTIKRLAIFGRLAAVALFVLIIPGGVIDLFPIHNAGMGEAAFRNDPLIDWVRKNTKGDAVFASDRYLGHPIMMAGRKIFFGWPYFTWGAGYDTGRRDPISRQIFENNDPVQLFQLLKDNGIDYVAYDDGIRRADWIRRPNERTYAKYFEKVWEDKQRRYGGLVIYKVPETPPVEIAAPEPGKSPPPGPAVNMFEGGQGTGRGQFDSPRGFTIDQEGNFFIADTNNGRVQKFSPNGEFVSSFGQKGWVEGDLMDPFGIAVDRTGNIYVVESSRARIQKFNPDGSLNDAWRRTPYELDLYGPRKVAIGPRDSLYLVDMGHARIIRYNFEGRQTGHWGTEGSADGQFKNMTSVAVDAIHNNVYVADPGNERIQVFDLDGTFLAKWPVPEWKTYWGFEDLAVDPQSGRLYASSATMDHVLVFDLDGNRRGSLRPTPPDKLDAPTAIAVRNGKLYILNNQAPRVSVINLPSSKEGLGTPNE